MNGDKGTYGRFLAKNGENVILRPLTPHDIDELVTYINDFVDEREVDPNLGVIFDKKITKEEEAEWIAKLLGAVESGRAVTVAAFAGDRIVGNGDVIAGVYDDERHHGKLGITVSRGYRNLGIGKEIMKKLIELSRIAGLKTIELEVFANNPRAIHLYESVGFKQAGIIPKKIFRKDRFIDIIVMSIVL
jgi:RimJ/RimL family protein N-acetyltransferase